MRKPVLLWVDLTISLRHAELPDVFTGPCDIRICPKPNALFDEIEKGGINGVCFDMDYPDRRGLELLRKTKSSFPSLPVLFVTLQHSESLAVWAFRSRVLDYLVKPVSRRDFQRSLQALRRMADVGATQRGRKPLDFSTAIPPEVPHKSCVDDVELLSAIYFVKQNYRDKIRSEEVAAGCGMSTFRFSRAFHETFGLTFQDYLLRYRILEACRLLRHPDANITKIAYSVGFNDASYFSRAFRRFIGTSPSAYNAEFEPDAHPELDISSIRLMLNLPDTG
jgi:AraC-like DNA-binding protein/CheY-like chemotaxis protein